MLNDPDKATFDEVVDSLTLDAEIIPTLELLWQKADNELAISRLDWLLRRAHINKLANLLMQWIHREGTLLEGAWLVATHLYPDLTFEEVEKTVDGIVRDIWVNMRDDMKPHEQVELINSVFFGKYKMRGDKRRNSAVDNIFINNVLRKRVACHIAMLILYHSVAEKLNIPIMPVMLFCALRLAYMSNDGESILFFIEPFDNGLIFDHATAKQIITRQGVPFDRRYIKMCPNELTIVGYKMEVTMVYKQKGMEEKVEEMYELLQNLQNSEQE